MPNENGQVLRLGNYRRVEIIVLRNSFGIDIIDYLIRHLMFLLSTVPELKRIKLNHEFRDRLNVDQVKRQLAYGKCYRKVTSTNCLLVLQH